MVSVTQSRKERKENRNRRRTSYNAAGAMTAFTRDDGSGTAVNNAYTFNTLYQMTNQTVTKGGTQLQNLSYVFPTTNNNGQIFQQIDHLSGEAVEYQYDSLNRLTSAETVGAGGWGLSWVYDGFGNRTNQNVTKGSAPAHSVTVNKNNNRIDTAGYAYDPNGNMTTMPLMTVGYDVANRMVTSNHSSAGTQIYGYNQANQRVFVRNGSTVTYYLYGIGGERLMEMQETCTTSCTGYAENQRWIYFAGRKMFQKTGSTLKAVTPNRLASEAKHFPYGETQGTPPSDTKDYFATYRRDGTGLDYAWNRYYSPTMGRFTTADPYGGSVKLANPQSWNRFSYVSNDPIQNIDPSGLEDERTWCQIYTEDWYCDDLPRGGGWFPWPRTRGRGAGWTKGRTVGRSKQVTDPSADRKWRSFAAEAIANLSETCKERINEALGITTQDLQQTASTAHFYEFGYLNDHDTGAQGHLNYAEATGVIANGDASLSITQVRAPNGNHSGAEDGGYGNSIFLGPDFRFSGNTDERRKATLIHELLHLAFRGNTGGLSEDNWLLFNFVTWKAGQQPEAGDYVFSEMISKYIDSDCQSIDQNVY